MIKRPFGSTGLMVSALGLGCNNFGGRIDLGKTRTVIDSAIDAGGELVKAGSLAIIHVILPKRYEECLSSRGLGSHALLGSLSPNLGASNLTAKLDQDRAKRRTTRCADAGPTDLGTS
jgi:hypothetical protein